MVGGGAGWLPRPDRRPPGTGSVDASSYLGRREACVMRTVGVVAVIAFVAAGCAQSPPRAPAAVEQAVDPTVGGTQLAAPEGTRWVGMNDVVVAVPEDWGTVIQPCEPPDGGTVAFRGRDTVVMDCGDYPTRGVSSVSIAATMSGAIPLGRRTDLFMKIDGVRLSHSGVKCRRGGPCETTFLVAGTGAVFRVVGQGRDGDSLVETIRDSVTRLPDGLTTVPYIEYGSSHDKAREQLAAAGLTAQVPEVNFPSYVTGTVPPAGSVVEKGTEIAVEIGDG